MINSLGHRVGRVLSLFSSRRNWNSPNPSPAGECAPPPFPPVWGEGTLAGERGVGRVPIPTTGHSLWESLYIRTLWPRPNWTLSRHTALRAPALGLSHQPLMRAYSVKLQVYFKQQFYHLVHQVYVCVRPNHSGNDEVFSHRQPPAYCILVF